MWLLQRCIFFGLTLKLKRLTMVVLTFPTFPVGLGFNDLTDAPWPHCILGRQGEFVPGAALEVLQTVRALAGTDRETAPLLAVVFGVLQDVT